MRRSALRLASKIAVLGSIALGGAVARADECGRPNALFAFPPEGATGVPINANLYARYEPSAEYLGEEVIVQQVDGTKKGYFPEFLPNESLLKVVPDEPLEPGAEYSVKWPSLRGVATATKGKALTVRFRAGDAEDQQLPSFGGVESVSWDVDRDRDDCTDRLAERYAFDLRVGSAEDDGGRDSLALLVYQTRGPEIDPNAPPVVIHMGPLPGSGHVHIERAADDVIGEVCFAAQVRDLLENVSASGHRTACVHTVTSPFFYGCTVGGGRARGDGWLLAVATMGIAMAVRRRKGARGRA